MTKKEERTLKVKRFSVVNGNAVNRHFVVSEFQLREDGRFWIQTVTTGFVPANIPAPVGVHYENRVLSVVYSHNGELLRKEYHVLPPSTKVLGTVRETLKPVQTNDTVVYRHIETTAGTTLQVAQTAAAYVAQTAHPKGGYLLYLRREGKKPRWYLIDKPASGETLARLAAGQEHHVHAGRLYTQDWNAAIAGSGKTTLETLLGSGALTPANA